MPSCPPTCPIVKRELKRQAAERQKTLQAGLSPSDKNEEEETSEDKIPDEGPSDFSFGDKELESDHDSQKNERRAEDEARRIEDDEGKSSRSARSGGSERRSLKHSGHDLSGRSSKSEKSRSKQEQTRKGDHAEHESDRFEHCDPSQENHCSSGCSPRRLKEKLMRRKLTKQKAVNEGYFKDLCICTFSCLLTELWNDPFIRKMFRSAALFAVGIKLCWEMDAWYIPTPSTI